MEAARPPSPTPEEHEVLRRLGEYKRLIRLTSLIGAALLAEVAVFNGLRSDTPATAFCAALFVTTFFCAGLCAAQARGGPEFQIDVIESLMRRGRVTEEMSMAQAVELSNNVIKPRIRSAKAYYYAAVVFTVLSALLLIGQAWSSFLTSPGQPVPGKASAAKPTPPPASTPGSK
jgi:hypothetical protein